MVHERRGPSQVHACRALPEVVHLVTADVEVLGVRVKAHHLQERQVHFASFFVCTVLCRVLCSCAPWCSAVMHHGAVQLCTMVHPGKFHYAAKKKIPPKKVRSRSRPFLPAPQKVPARLE